MEQNESPSVNPPDAGSSNDFQAHIDWRSSSPFHSWYALDVRRARVASCTAAASARTFSPRRTDFPPGILPRDNWKTECDETVEELVLGFDVAAHPADCTTVWNR